MRLSVVIPTFDRKERLTRVLDVLSGQMAEVPGGCEVLVADDGSTDGTRELLATLQSRGRVEAVLLEHAGPARARNRAASQARGEILLFLGDDTTPEGGFLAGHERAHRETPGPVAVLGYTSWDTERLRVTPFLTYLNEHGAQFGYALIQDPENVPFNFFYTSNVSMPRRLFLDLGGFDETFPAAVWEDVELAYRATRARNGAAPLRIVYRPALRVRHDHPTELADFLDRQRRSGRAAAVLARRHSELSTWLGVEAATRIPARRPLSVSVFSAAVRLLDPIGVPLPGRVYDKILRWDYLVGLEEGRKEVPAG